MLILDRHVSLCAASMAKRVSSLHTSCPFPSPDDLYSGTVFTRARRCWMQRPPTNEAGARWHRCWRANGSFRQGMGVHAAAGGLQVGTSSPDGCSTSGLVWASARAAGAGAQVAASAGTGQGVVIQPPARARHARSCMPHPTNLELQLRQKPSRPRQQPQPNEHGREASATAIRPVGRPTVPAAVAVVNFLTYIRTTSRALCLSPLSRSVTPLAAQPLQSQSAGPDYRRHTRSCNLHRLARIHGAARQ
jgi:hypothetical protein